MVGLPRAGRTRHGGRVAFLATPTAPGPSLRRALCCSGVASITGLPDSGTGSILLIDGEAPQRVRITCTATLDANCENAGLVYAYRTATTN